ncbi:MAG: alanine dehydrogenase [Chlorobi bacterium]|nr:alanine dehydrogenase [Chlorobiota bacterium]
MKQPYYPKEILIPQEERLAVLHRKGELHIGIPKEIHLQEKRVCLTPDGVATLVSHGHKIMIESGAGEGALYSDHEYAEAGAEVVYDRERVFGNHLVLKVEPPTPEEVEMMKPGSVLMSALQINVQKRKFFDALIKRRITALAFEFIRDQHGMFPVVRAQSEIAGMASILIAAELLSKPGISRNLLLGNLSGVPPAEVVILGAGTVGEFAARTALGLGASVKVFDNSLSKLRRLQTSVGRVIYTSTLQPTNIANALVNADVVIGALRGEIRTPVVITEYMVEMMKPGSVLIDVSIDRGGVSETSELTTHANPVVIKHDVIHYGVPNIPSRYSRTATIAFSNIFVPYLRRIAELGGIEKAIETDIGLRNGVYAYRGMITNKTVAEWFGFDYRDINLIFLK